MCLMFDMREDGEADPCKLAQMMQNLGVFISIKPKIKQTSKVQLPHCSFSLFVMVRIISILKCNKNFVVLFWTTFTF